jgi:hypothetical protein
MISEIINKTTEIINMISETIIMFSETINKTSEPIIMISETKNMSSEPNHLSSELYGNIFFQRTIDFFRQMDYSYFFKNKIITKKDTGCQEKN